MNQSPTEYAPYSYDPERVKTFLRRTSHYKNLPKRYQPEPDMDPALVVDALIGAYIDASERQYADFETDEKSSEAHQRNLARVALAIKYLEGDDLDDLKSAAASCLTTTPLPQYITQYVLDVARQGSREVTRSLDEQNGIEAEVVEGEAKMEIIEGFEDLADTIKRLYEEERMRSAQAQALLLSFGLQASSAPPESKRAAVLRSRLELERRIAVAKLEPTVYGASKSTRIRINTGFGYLNSHIGKPRLRLPGTSLRSVIDQVRMVQDMEDDPKVVERHVHSHIGYVLNILYK